MFKEKMMLILFIMVGIFFSITGWYGWIILTINNDRLLGIDTLNYIILLVGNILLTASTLTSISVLKNMCSIENKVKLARVDKRNEIQQKLNVLEEKFIHANGTEKRNIELDILVAKQTLDYFNSRCRN